MPLETLCRPSALAWRVVLATVASGMFTVSSASAQDVPRPPEDQPAVTASATSTPPVDPPARVGRLTALEGAVSFEPASDTEWGAAEPNRPVTTGDRVWSDTAGHAEIEMGSATARVWHQTELDITRLDDNSLQLRLPQGTVTVRLSTFADGETAEIDAPNAAVTLGSTGDYRVEVSPDGATTTVTVHSGSAEVTSAGSSFALVAHQSATIRGDSAPTYDVAVEGSSDDFDQWSSSRDEVADRAPRQYVPSDMPGTEDLDDNGSWDNDADYGPVWYPTTVEVGWAPYHTGHWVWMGRWGWTWVDEAPWGWAPFHYGRWAYVRERWGWCPGRVIAPAVFAPGLVVFVGGAGWGASAGFGPAGGLGWFALAPEEAYRPAYAVSNAYYRRVNITNVTNITVINNTTVINYRNRGVPNAVIAVPRTAFTNASPVSHVAVHIPEGEIRGAVVIGAAPSVAPTRESLIAHVVGRPLPHPPVEIARRVVVAVHAPPPASVPFALQEHALAANGGKPLPSAQLAALRRSTPAATLAARALPVRSAAAPMSGGATLKPARAGLPAPRPAFQTGTLARAVTPPPSASVPRPPVAQVPRDQATTPPQQNAPSPTPSNPATATRVSTPATPLSRAPAARAPVRTASPALNASYVAERTQMESRHVQQFAKPPAGVSPDALAEQQQAEHNELESRYHQAATAGKTTMPPRAAPRPAPRPARAPAKHK